MVPFYCGFIGTYTQSSNSKSEGIYSFTLDAKTGEVEDLHLAARADNPSWLSLHPAGQCLYVVNELDDFNGKEKGGAVSVYSIKNDGSLDFINQKTTQGKSPCHLAINSGASYAIAANYYSGSITVFPLAHNGAINDPCQIIQFSGKGPNSLRQEAPHAHSFLFDKTCAFGLAMDLGTDRVMAYQFSSNTAEPLKPADVPWYNSLPGSGPRHGIFNPRGTCVYIVNEIDSTLNVLKYNSIDGSVINIQTISCLPENCKTQSTCAAVKISPDGNFVYVSNRGHDSITVFKVKRDDTLDFIDAISSGGRTPRDFGITPNGNYLLALNQDSDNLVVFHRDETSGCIEKKREYPVPAPVCVIFR
ncbi:lactonase family protein [Leadbettera azotonutricia]|uniref:6-phosphogluconolactonase n=1 Tax=Leadbettera azotonutricia (strain ATCC BAA-888 / DSM 13862 / ZAS-9) TaxID=545695 RepID=F5YGB9_LEAAZ|nr:lactonase family protein [Leadbettera azotonutricia]AEF80067.1 6-phosphogluconolactonase [Leadbettera azotonutricia ZAS-9]